MPRLSFPAKGIIFSITLSLGLISCGSGSRPVLKQEPAYPVTAKYDIPDEDGEIAFTPRIAQQSDGSITILRRTKAQERIVEHHTSDALTIDWSVPIPAVEKEQWNPILRYVDNKLFCAGEIDYSDYDSAAFRCMTIDPVTHSIVSDTWYQRGYEEHYNVFSSAPKQTQLHISRSRDSSHFIAYKVDAPDEDPKAPGHVITIHFGSYNINGTRLDSGTITMPLPSTFNGTSSMAQRGSALEMGNYGLLSVGIDNHGNLFIAKRTANDTIAFITYPSRSKSPSKTILFSYPDKDFNPEDIPLAVDGVFPMEKQGVYKVICSHHKVSSDAIMPDIICVSLDFTSGALKSFQYKPSKEQLKSLVDQKDLDGFSVSDIIQDRASSNSTLVIEKRINYEMTPSTPGNPGHVKWVNYCNGILLLVFDPAGKPLYQYALPSEPGEKTDAAIQTSADSKLKVYYSDDELTPGGLYYRELDMQSGAFSTPIHLASFESGGQFLMNYSILNQPKSAIFFAGDYTGRWGGRYRFPIMFRIPKP